jgi:hypothetical protein
MVSGLSRASASSIATSKGRKRSEPAQTGAGKHPQAERRVVEVRNIIKWQCSKRTWRLGFGSVIYNILAQGAPINRVFVRGSLERVGLYLQTDLDSNQFLFGLDFVGEEISPLL